MALSDYLASKYLSADSTKQSKKRKRKHAASTGLQIADDDVNTWNKRNNDDDDDADSPLVVSDDPSQINKRTATWKTIGAEAPSNAEQEAADAILAKAAEDRLARAKAEDEADAPAIVDDGGFDVSSSVPQMASGAMAGLQTAAQITSALQKREREERQAMEDQGLDPSGKATETIYRDASGRIINVAMKRAELRRKAEEEQDKKKAELQSSLGDVQRREKEAAKQQLESARFLSLSRYADDVELNSELKDKARWNDPAAQFLSTKSGSSTTRAVGGKKVYQGASEPNRYGIKPGYRWDGVDRSNGFERKWFAARNKKANDKELAYAWEMDE